VRAVAEGGGVALPDSGAAFRAVASSALSSLSFAMERAAYATDSRYASASSAAMQPVPALVTAWR
jgi:hypothetical protein